MPHQQKKYRRFFSSLSGSTLVEILVVMIVSGILFLMVFDGLSIIQQYGGLLNRKLMQKSALLHTHLTIELLMERSDSIRKVDGKVMFYTHATDTSDYCLIVDSTNLLLYRDAYIDTLYSNLIKMDFHFLAQKNGLVDSIFILIKPGKDAIQLSYGLPSVDGKVLNTFSE